MGTSMSTLRWVAPASWAINLGAQIYGMSSTPSMLDVHNANQSFFMPQGYFIAAFFTPQQFVQVAWLYRLISLSSSGRSKSNKAAASSSTSSSSSSSSLPSSELAIVADYAPTFALGNLCIAAWMLLWNNSNLRASAVAVWINSLAQLAYLVGLTGNLQPMNRRSWSSILTHVNVKTFAGIGVLDLLHNTSVAWALDQRAGVAIKVLTGLGFGLASAASDWVFGGSLVYDLVALAVGQRHYDPSWSRLLAVYAAGAAATVGLKNWYRPPYVDYDLIASEDDDSNDNDNDNDNNDIVGGGGGGYSVRV